MHCSLTMLTFSLLYSQLVRNLYLSMLLLYLYVVVIFLQQLKKKKKKKKKKSFLFVLKKNKTLSIGAAISLSYRIFFLKTSMLHGMLTYWCFCKRDVHKCILHCHNDSLGMLFFGQTLFKYARAISPSLSVAQSSGGFFFPKNSLIGTFL